MQAATVREAVIRSDLVSANALVERAVPVKGVTIINKKLLLNLSQRPTGKVRNACVFDAAARIALCVAIVPERIERSLLCEASGMPSILDRAFKGES
jgi:hypothetical protein